MLDSLEKEYKREGDWCNTDKANSMDKVTHMTQLLAKHQEQKEAFLKVGVAGKMPSKRSVLSCITLTTPPTSLENLVLFSTLRRVHWPGGQPRHS